MNIIAGVYPQPPESAQIMYMLGGEEWLAKENRSPIRILCETWGNLGPLELNREIPPDKAGFRVKHDEILAPDGCIGFKQIDGKYYWTDTDCYGRNIADLESQQ
ncbi:hypothetical protein [Herbaspirillum aquaticum]|uniref:hypothetical protein n=1 Tax=Herbaspirillum aquaticum TaxID=568783 RepID=UPI0024DE608E|nr:hypothetical protein [Herbaspirillum aquaticum]